MGCHPSSAPHLLSNTLQDWAPPPFSSLLASGMRQILTFRTFPRDTPSASGSPFSPPESPQISDIHLRSHPLLAARNGLALDAVPGTQTFPGFPFLRANPAPQDLLSCFRSPEEFGGAMYGFKGLRQVPRRTLLGGSSRQWERSSDPVGGGGEGARASRGSRGHPPATPPLRRVENHSHTHSGSRTRYLPHARTTLWAPIFLEDLPPFGVGGPPN